MKKVSHIGAKEGEMSMATSPESFPAYCRRDRSALVNLATHLTGSPADGEDLAHDVLEQLSQCWPRVAGLDSVDAYARRALINKSRTRHKRRQAEQALLDLLAQSTAITSPAPDLVDDDLWALVRALPGRQAAVVALVVLDGWSQVEVAAILGISAANARQHFWRACERLRTRIVLHQ